MKTKTLLIAAAALAVGVISSQAQVYSQNVVGYVNQTVNAGNYFIIGSQLVGGSDANQTNGNINATLANGFVSQPLDPPSTHSNSVVYIWTGSGYQNFYYFNQADATTWNGASSPAGWYDEGGTLSTATLTSGQSAFIYNHSSSPMTITTVGNVKQGTNTSLINAGYNLIGIQEPVFTTNLFVSGYGLPLGLTSSPQDPPLQSRNDTIFVWKGSGYVSYYYFNEADATSWNGTASPAGFYDGGGSLMPSSDCPSVNQGFFLYHTGPAVVWTNSYSVQ